MGKTEAIGTFFGGCDRDLYLACGNITNVSQSIVEDVSNESTPLLARQIRVITEIDGINF